MGFDRQDGLGKSVDSPQKGHRQSFVVFALSASLAIAVGLACSSTPPQPKNVAPSIQSLQVSSGLPLTSIGVNHGARFSRDGKRILFLSGERQQHRNQQLYELSLETFRERRITFHDGDCLEANYTPNQEGLIYASTTDELKERPVLLYPLKSPHPPSELYHSDLKGNSILRITQTPGYQSQFAWVGTKQLLFVSEEQGRLVIQSLTPPGARITTWRQEDKADLSLPSVDPVTGRVAFVIRRADGAVEIGFRVKDKWQSLPTSFSEIQSLDWMEGPRKGRALLLSGKWKGEARMKAWVVDPEEICATLLLEDVGDLRDLRVGPRQEKLVYSFGEPTQSQIYLREFPALPPNCQPLKAEVPAPSASATPAVGPSPDPKTPPNSGASRP